MHIYRATKGRREGLQRSQREPAPSSYHFCYPKCLCFQKTSGQALVTESLYAAFCCSVASGSDRCPWQGCGLPPALGGWAERWRCVALTFECFSQHQSFLPKPLGLVIKHLVSILLEETARFSKKVKMLCECLVSLTEHPINAVARCLC